MSNWIKLAMSAAAVFGGGYIAGVITAPAVDEKLMELVGPMGFPGGFNYDDGPWGSSGHWFTSRSKKRS